MKKIKFPHIVIALLFAMILLLVTIGLFKFFMSDGDRGYSIPIPEAVFLIILIVPQLLSFVLGAVWMAGQRHYTIEEMILSVENQRTCEFIIFQAEEHKKFLKDHGKK